MHAVCSDLPFVNFTSWIRRLPVLAVFILFCVLGVAAKAVSSDGEEATKDDKTPRRLIIPDGTKKIDWKYSRNFLSSDSVWIPASVEEIEYGAFVRLNASAIFEVDKENPCFKSVDGALVTKDGKTLIRGVVRSDGSAVVPDGVKELDYYSFKFREPIKLVRLPASLEEIPKDFFETYPLLTRFEVAEDNPFFQSVDGALLTKEDKILLHGVIDSDGAVVVPDGTKRIWLDAFNFKVWINYVWIPSSVEEIDKDVFGDFNESTQIEIAEDSPFFQCVDGALLTKKDKKLIFGVVGQDGSAIIPDGTKKVGAFVFSGDWRAKRVLIPESVEEFEEKAFYGFKASTRYEVDAGNPVFQSVDGALVRKKDRTLIRGVVGSDGFAVVPDCTKRLGAEVFDLMRIDVVFIPSGVEEIEEGAFDFLYGEARFEVAAGNPFFQSVDGSLLRKDDKTLLYGAISSDGFFTAPDGTKRIWAKSFRSPFCLKHVLIPSSVEEIDVAAFYGTRTARFDVGDKNPRFQSVDGALLTKDGQTLIRGFANPDGDAVTPEGTKTIAKGAFVKCDSLRSVTIPASVETIDERAFDHNRPIIRGAADSAAEQYAKKNGFTFERLEKAN